METGACKITIHMVSSVDGIIAKSDNSVSWFETTDNYAKGVTGEDPETFLKSIDCYIMGARTYEHALELSRSYGWAYGETPVIVLTNRNLPVERPTVECYTGDLATLVKERLAPRYRNVWLAGGPILAREFIRQSLADELRVTVLPLILGEGKLFFDHIGREVLLHVKDVIAYKNGMIELCYEIKK